MWKWIRQIVTLIGILYLATQLGVSFAATPKIITLAQTVPSRTPTPSANATDTPAPPPTSPPPGDTPIASPSPSAVASPIVSNTLPPIAPTPVGGYLATAEPCGQQPTVISLTNWVNVRRGPGQDYEPITQLIYFEVRPIIGRAANAPWWQIRLNAEQTGWVADSAITVQGDTQYVAIVPSPAINGNTPTPGALWNPTPNPVCPVLTMTPTATNSPFPVTPTLTSPPLTTTNTPLPATLTSEPTATTIVVVVPTPEITPSEVPAFTPLPTLVNTNPPPTDSSSWLLYGGIGLLFVGIFALFIRSRR